MVRPLKEEGKTRAVLATPSLSGPMTENLQSIGRGGKVLIEAGYDVGYVDEIGCPYISHARSTMLKKAMDLNADMVVFIDYDVSFDDQALLKVVQTEGDVVAGVYRFRQEKEEYMMTLADHPTLHRPIVREDGAVKAISVCAGLLKITAKGVDRFMTAYPELTYGPKYSLLVDLFNHGAHKGVWYSEDYAFCRRWTEMGGEIWIVPDLTLSHHGHTPDGEEPKVYTGNVHNYLRRQPGGDLSECPVPPEGKTL